MLHSADIRLIPSGQCSTGSRITQQTVRKPNILPKAGRIYNICRRHDMLYAASSNRIFRVFGQPGGTYFVRSNALSTQIYRTPTKNRAALIPPGFSYTVCFESALLRCSFTLVLTDLSLIDDLLCFPVIISISCSLKLYYA